MKLTYVANIRMPTERAHGAQILHMCAAFARAGIEIELIVPQRHTAITEDTFSYYGIRERFPIIYIPVPDIVAWGRAGFLLESVLFANRAKKRVARNSLIYGRDEIVLFFFRTKNIVWESHVGAWNFFARRTAQQCAKLVVISEGLRTFYKEKGIAAEKIAVAHDGVDLKAFERPQSKAQARERLGLPLDKKIALYIGSLDGWKGTATLCEAAEKLPGNVVVAIIGGTAEQIKKYKERYPKVLFLGARPYRELPENQNAADVLILPNSGKSRISEHFTSPLKLFSYMASGIPMVASDLPSIREIADETCAYLVRPDDPHMLAEIIVKALSDPEASRKAANALEKVSQYTWDARAKRLLFLFLRQQLEQTV